MKEIKISKLTRDAFAPFGTFTKLVDYNTERFGFFPDLIQLNLGGTHLPSFSVNRNQETEVKIIRGAEGHTNTGEGIMPIDGDILIHVAPPSRPDRLDSSLIKVFLVPAGTFVALRPGAWHLSPFPYKKEIVYTMVVLPERTYAKDSYHVRFEEADYIQILDEFED